ncbi:hypothetical protein BDV95DRAFT_588429 [Massariosphaeria phaeospora]|uniref:Uncharacterized protein n=1 Tax=Massariosphaeria phaeospora TaxID=100035 RepID=A0A7C8M3N9_9PLEO|nr:hypothetical protein BDV95DRAFT_588429 [Massariosphaeria phaeospora]
MASRFVNQILTSTWLITQDPPHGFEVQRDQGDGLVCMSAADISSASAWALLLSQPRSRRLTSMSACQSCVRLSRHFLVTVDASPLPCRRCPGPGPRAWEPTQTSAHGRLPECTRTVSQRYHRMSNASPGQTVYRIEPTVKKRNMIHLNVPPTYL